MNETSISGKYGVTITRGKVDKFEKFTNIPIAHADPWVWRIESTGKALTKYGAENGIELHFSYKTKGNKL